MRLVSALFVFASLFGLATATAYWFLSHEPAGAILLGFVGASMAFAAGYAFVAEREARVEGDEQPAPRSSSGDDLGIFTSSSAWPILTALCAAVSLVSLLYSPLLCVLALVALLLCIWRMGAESARAP